MYLENLSSEEKVLFMGVAYHLAHIDGDYCINERNMMQAYCNEMGCEFDLEKVAPLDDIIKDLAKKADMKTKKIIIFEAIGLAICDNKYDDDERAFIGGMTKVFNIEPAFVEQSEKVLIEYISFQSKINNLVIG